jgi:hypothetical protein
MSLAPIGVKRDFRRRSNADCGYCAENDKLQVHDIRATLLHLLGLDYEELTYRYAGRDFGRTYLVGHSRTRDLQRKRTGHYCQIRTVLLFRFLSPSIARVVPVIIDLA